MKEVGNNALELGLLFGNEEEMMEGENEWLSFPHKIIHEYIAACYLVQDIKKNGKILRKLFPTWKDIKRHEEVYNFCIGCSSDAGQASVLIRHFCAVLSETMIRKVKLCWDTLCHSGIYKIDTQSGQSEERKGHSDKAELTQVFSAISGEARPHENTCTNPVCNEYIHVYPACRNTDPSHIRQSKLIVFTDIVKTPHRSSSSSNARDNISDQYKKDDKCLVIFSDKQQELSGINYAMSYCNVTQVYMRGCDIDHSGNGSIDQDVNNMFTQYLQSLYMRDCVLTCNVWDEIGRGLTGSKAMKCVMLWDCTGVTEYLITCIVRLTTLKWLKLHNSKLSSEMCGVICRWLIHLIHLEKLGLADNPVGEHVTHITAAIRAWGPAAPLRRLYLQHCELPADRVPVLLSAVTQCCPLLEHLNIGGNNVGGCLPSFMAAAQASLQRLIVFKCNLQPEDVASITTALFHNTLPQLEFLNMHENSLTDSMVEPLLQAANTHHQGKLEVNLTNNKLSTELTTRWISQCRPRLHLFLHPQSDQLLSYIEVRNIMDDVIASIERESEFTIQGIADMAQSKIQLTGKESRFSIDSIANHICIVVTSQYLSDAEYQKLRDDIIAGIDRESEFSVESIADMVRTKIPETGKQCPYSINAIAYQMYKEVTNQYLSDTEYHKLRNNIIAGIDRESKFSVESIADTVRRKIHQTGKEYRYTTEFIANSIYKEVTTQYLSDTELDNI